MIYSNSKSNFHYKESGNILIYILGAIFLLGLLVVMVKGSSTPGSNIDRETLIIRISEVQAYSQELERAVAYIIRNGHSETEIRFSHPDADVAYGDITDTPSRQVFAVEGGAAKYRAPPENIQTTPTDWLFTAANSVGTVGSGNVNTNLGTDLIAMLPNVTRDFCAQISAKVNLANLGDPLIQDQGTINLTTPFVGNYTWANEIQDTAATAILNTPEGCVEGGGTPPTETYHYYRVLLPR